MSRMSTIGEGGLTTRCRNPFMLGSSPAEPDMQIRIVVTQPAGVAPCEPWWNAEVWLVERGGLVTDRERGLVARRRASQPRARGEGVGGGEQARADAALRGSRRETRAGRVVRGGGQRNELAEGQGRAEEAARIRRVSVETG